MNLSIGFLCLIALVILLDIFILIFFLILTFFKDSIVYKVIVDFLKI